MSRKHVAVIDIGKTNAKLALVDMADLSEIVVVTRPNKVLPGPPWPHFDIDGHWEFLLSALTQFHSEHGIDAISITTHGACAALLDADGNLAAPILDYEHPGPDELTAEYDQIRPSFEETGSPKLAGGLNIGAQLYWQFSVDKDLKQRTSTIVTYPQYWSFRLTGKAASDVSSLGCHTDLWNPHEGRYSTLASKLEIDGKIAPARASADLLGSILPQIAARTGLPPDTAVVCGIHDSNASLLPHLLSHAAPFSVVSTGTWVIAMSVGGTNPVLNPEQDTLVNVDAFGKPVPSARFMGGREFDIATDGRYVDPTAEEVEHVLNKNVMLLPALEPNTGPFRGMESSWIGDEPPEGSGVRSAAVSFYLALVTAHCLKLIGHAGPIIVEGPFAQNACYCSMLGAATDSEVWISQGATGTSQGAALLVDGGPIQTFDRENRQETFESLAGFAGGYIQNWRSELGI
ncbi:MAG: FGGY-family carbohydrate kinase [Rhizobiaceae bacterium]